MTLDNPLKWINRTLKSLGIDLGLFLRSLNNIPFFIRDGLTYQKMNSSEFTIRKRMLYPVLGDRDDFAAKIEGHYFLQDLWAAKKIYKKRPAHHWDIGSRIDGFVAHLLTFMPVEVIDIRPLECDIENLTFTIADAKDLSTIKTGSVESLSSLHAVEHFGLGRYGDEVDPDACFSAMKSMARILREGGTFYFSVPIGIERLEFNAHRVFNPKTILDQFSALTLKSFSIINDNGILIQDVNPEDYSDVIYSCGLFEFSK